MPFPAESPSGMALHQMAEAMKAGVSMEIPDMEIHPKDVEQKYGVLLSPNDGSKCHVIDSLANIQPLTARDLFDPALQKATMYALGCKSMKEVKAKFAKKCACGSGKKFKNCCLQKVLDEANAEEAQ